MSLPNSHLLSKTHNQFVLISSDATTERKLFWNNENKLLWDNKNVLKLNATSGDSSQKQTYRFKKSILSSLPNELQHSKSNFKIREGFSRNSSSKRILSTSNSTSSLQKIKSYIFANTHRLQSSVPSNNFGVDEVLLSQKIKNSKIHHKKIISIISMRRFGLRYKFNYMFVEMCSCSKKFHEHGNNSISNQIKISSGEWQKMYKKQLYYYHLNGQVINQIYQDLDQKQMVILVDLSPKLNLTYELHLQLVELSTRIQQAIIRCSEQVQTYDSNCPDEKSGSDGDEKQGKNEEQEGQRSQVTYDWQRIPDVNKYVDVLFDNPESKVKKLQERDSQLLVWYKEKFHNNNLQNKVNDKNLLFQSISHYAEEIKNVKMLALANQKVEHLQITNNRHKFKSKPLEIMMEKVQREGMIKGQREGMIKGQREGIIKDTNVIKSKAFQPTTSKKQIINKLNTKNSLLSTQNIPYMIEKYGINRFQIYNLYNLYKSFQKISAMRIGKDQRFQQILEKGIDRETFDEGLKGLDMNPGEELIKNICNFGDFISWEQFIKIVSISLRKTPEEKLTAILQGISSSSDDYLTKNQIHVMIGGSLLKIFDSEQKELQEYFTEMAMNQFDPQGKGRVEIQLLKAKVLNKGSDNMNMVSFLILNS